MAKPYLGQPGSGMHIHFSLLDGNNQNLFADGTVSGSESLLHAVAGALRAQNATDVQLANQYIQQGENEKALILFEKLEKDIKNIPLIHENYFQLMLVTGRFDQAEKYIQRAIKRYPSNLYYQIDRGLIYVQRNQKSEARKYFESIISDISDDPFKVRIAAQHFSKNQQLEFALETYRQSRKKLSDPLAYSIQMASIYRLLNQKENMIEEYLNYTNQNYISIKVDREERPDLDQIYMNAVMAMS